MLKGLFSFMIIAAVAIGGQGCDQNGGQVDSAAPDFTLDNTLEDAPERVSLEELAGQVVVLEWFNYDCPFVQDHYVRQSTMIDLADKYADQGVLWLAIDSTADIRPEENRRFAQEYGITYPILDDSSGQVGRAYGATRTPEMFIIDTDGEIVYAGAIDNAPLGNLPEGQEYVNYVDQALDQLLAGQQISVNQTEPYGCTVKY